MYNRARKRARTLSRTPNPTIAPIERAFLIGLDVQTQPQILGLEDSLEELALLADTAVGAVGRHRRIAGRW